MKKESKKNAVAGQNKVISKKIQDSDLQSKFIPWFIRNLEIENKQNRTFRKGARLRNSTYKGHDYSHYMGINGASIYWEDDDVLEKILYGDDTEFVISATNRSRKIKGVRRRKKKQNKL